MRVKKTINLNALIAWIVVLFCSLLPEILMSAAGLVVPDWWAWFQVLLALVILLISMLTSILAPLRVFLLFFTVYLLLWRAMTVIRSLQGWQEWEAGAGWVAGISAIQGLKMGFALLLLAGLFFILRKRQVFFFMPGKAANPAEPVKWLGMKTPTPWNKFGLTIALFFFLGGIAFLWLSNQPALSMVMKTLPLLPCIILISATNAFSEEVMFRSALLAPLQLGIPRSAALAMISVFFGLAHYSGTFPSGLIWVLLTGFLGFLFGKAMLETRGLGMPWLLHLFSDIPVFFFTAVFSIN